MNEERDEYNHFVCVVVGNNPFELLEPYDKSKKTNPRVLFKFSEADNIKKRYLMLLESLKNKGNLSDKEYKNICDLIEDVKEEDSNDFFYEYTDKYEHDKETGDAITTENQKGKWESYQIGKVFSVPFALKDGSVSFQAKKGDIDWSKMHHFNTEIYEKAWDLCMGGKEPKDDEEKTIYNNMSNKTAYFNKFGNKKTYVESCTAFWGYAFLSKETGWVELEPDKDQFEWMNSFYDKYIHGLDDNELITIVECRR